MSKRLSRRKLIATLAATAAADGALAQPIASGVFAHGVASGDPRADSVVLWTRLSLRDGAESAEAAWQVATDEAFADIVAGGAARTGPERDWTVKVEAAGLAPGQRYHYRFIAAGEASPVGRTRTLPVGAVRQIRLAVVSCANYAQGCFNAYAAIADDARFDAVIHLGDYIYEYGPTGYAGADRQLRAHAPAHELLTLADYRTRHAQYKTDAGAQALHAAHPLIAIWDDHEVADNAWAEGAHNHQPGEGDYAARKAAALQAFYEWMPVRAPRPGASPAARFESFAFGDLAHLHLLETRLSARARPYAAAELPELVASHADAERFQSETLGDPARAKLGAAQLARLEAAFAAARAAGVTWTVLANPTLLARVRAPDIAPHLKPGDRERIIAGWSQGEGMLLAADHGLPLFMDSWDGYPAERERLYDAARRAGVNDLLVLTGDTHAWWANDLAAADGAPMGVELCTASVTSTSAFSPDNLGDKSAGFALLVNRDNPAVRYLSGQSHGFIDLTLTPARAHAVFRAVETIERPSTATFRQAAFAVERRGGALKLHARGGLGFRERWLF